MSNPVFIYIFYKVKKIKIIYMIYLYRTITWIPITAVFLYVINYFVCAARSLDLIAQ